MTKEQEFLEKLRSAARKAAYQMEQTKRAMKEIKHYAEISGFYVDEETGEVFKR